MKTEKRYETLEKFYETTHAFNEISVMCNEYYNGLSKTIPSKELVRVKNVLSVLRSIHNELLNLGQYAYEITMYMSNEALMENVFDTFKMKYPSLSYRTRENIIDALRTQYPRLSYKTKHEIISEANKQYSFVTRAIIKVFDNALIAGNHCKSAIEQFSERHGKLFYTEYKAATDMRGDIIHWSSIISNTLHTKNSDVIWELVKELTISDSEITEFISVNSVGNTVLSKKNIDKLYHEVKDLIDLTRSVESDTESLISRKLYLYTTDTVKAGIMTSHAYANKYIILNRNTDISYKLSYLEETFKSITNIDLTSDTDSSMDEIEIDVSKYTFYITNLKYAIKDLIIRKEVYNMMLINVMLDMPSMSELM